jgi:hypothetical protein
LGLLYSAVQFTMFGQVCRRRQKPNDLGLIDQATVRRSAIFRTVLLTVCKPLLPLSPAPAEPVPYVPLAQSALGDPRRSKFPDNSLLAGNFQGEAAFGTIG